jgi:SAM-dependent methyltransferase
MNWQMQHGLEFMNLLQVQPKQYVLDLGCGSGELTVELAQRVGEQGRVIGLDPNKDRIKVAQRKYGHLKNLEFLEGTNDDMKKHKPLDQVFCSFVIHWIRDQTKCFSQVYDVLQPGGVFGILGLAGLSPFLPKLTRVMAGPHVHLNKLMDWRYLPLDELTDLAKRVGFNVIHSDQLSADSWHPNLEHLLLWWEATTSGKCLVENINEKYLNEFLHEFKIERNQPTQFTETLIRTILQKPL